MHDTNIKWNEFVIGETFILSNSKPYHKSDVVETEDKDKIPYITRTSLNNGIEMHVKADNSFKINSGNQIVFGAESAKFFYQEFPFITGNKMYLLNHEKMNKFIGLFLVNALQNAVKGSGFGFSLGMTASRLSKRNILLPVNSKNEPYWEYMEIQGHSIFKQNKGKVKNYYIQKIKKLKTNIVIKNINDIKWQPFLIPNIINIKSGVRLTKEDQVPGKYPFIGASEIHNGVTNFVSNTNTSLEANILGVNYNGAVVKSFYHPYKSLFSDDVKRMEIKNSKYRNKYTYLFLATCIEMQKIKYMYSYKFSAQRMAKQYIMLPVNEKNEPDWEYMELYMKKKEYEKMSQIIEYLK